ncbi:acid phosphatase [Rhizobium leucaenae]|uniref:acid phosphatase n=1 Tax=Rhizobium leucaenae TaxID=29450 RepID=UPI00161704D9|nr:acid phosphatase [Rhizobium leucaenae]MBB6304808.1 phospholipase C [Rhizobium leucaenae]
MKSITAAAVCALSFSVAAFSPAIAGDSASGTKAGSAGNAASDLKLIDTVVVIYAENRSFDNLYGSFPGANGVSKASASARIQRDRDGKPFRELPPIWEGLTAKGVTPPVTQAETEHLPNRPFRADDPKGFNLSPNTITRDLWHRYYQNQMQIDGGRNDKFVAFADSGALVMSSWDGSKMAMWKIAQKYVLADNFFMGAFGGSFFNHQWLICACAPYYPNADTSAAKPSIAVVEPDGVTLKAADNSPKSAVDGIPKFVGDGNLTPDFYAVNTMQPPYQPSGNGPAPDGDKALADPAKPTTLPPQIEPTIGDMLSLKHVTWAWYGGAWQDVLDHGNKEPVPNLQYHHQPFNYYANFAPGTAARTEHLRDGGLGGVEFIKAIDAGMLPQVSFYKPQGNLNEHSGYADIEAGDAHIADLIGHLEKSPQWPHMLVVVTYDENGGLWDHVVPPKGDRWGPGSRIPAIIVSPFARHGYVDHTPMDTTSILRFITRRFELPTLHGITVRDTAIAAHKQKPLGDLTSALVLKEK